MNTAPANKPLELEAAMSQARDFLAQYYGDTNHWDICNEDHINPRYIFLLIEGECTSASVGNALLPVGAPSMLCWEHSLHSWNNYMLLCCCWKMRTIPQQAF